MACVQKLGGVLADFAFISGRRLVGAITDLTGTLNRPVSQVNYCPNQLGSCPQQSN